jgi:hypothetical protein
MTINQTSFEGSDKLALDYIRQRGYCSYSSMVNVIQKRDPEPFKETTYYRFGKEHHSRFLERKKTCQLTLPEEKALKEMVYNLAEDALVQKIMENVQVEQEFDVVINGLRMYGRIDILGADLVGDLKTTSIPNLHAFRAKMDLLQVVIYKRAKIRKNSWYIGSCKLPPYHPLVFKADNLPAIREAEQQLDYYTRYIKSKL